jgi:hypothetical protein
MLPISSLFGDIKTLISISWVLENLVTVYTTHNNTFFSTLNIKVLGSVLMVLPWAIYIWAFGSTNFINFLFFFYLKKKKKKHIIFCKSTLRNYYRSRYNILSVSQQWRSPTFVSFIFPLRPTKYKHGSYALVEKLSIIRQQYKYITTFSC